MRGTPYRSTMSPGSNGVRLVTAIDQMEGSLSMLQNLVPSALLILMVAVTTGITPLTARALEWRSGTNGQRFQQIKPVSEHADGQAHAATLSMRELQSSVIRVEAQAAGEVAPLFGNLGSHHRPITASSELAQRYFDEG